MATQSASTPHEEDPHRTVADENKRWAYLDISNPLVAWLAYRGEVFSAPDEPGAMSIWHTGRLRSHTVGAPWYRIETHIEAARQTAWPSRASRLRGFYTFADIETATRAASMSPSFRPENLTELTVTHRLRESRHDADWITSHFGTGPGPWVADYLSGVPMSAEPTWEHIIEGAARIESNELRDRAWDRVQGAWPKTLDILELSRVACLLGSPLGRSVAFGIEIPGESERAPRDVEVSYYLDFRDATNTSPGGFIERLAAFMSDPANQERHGVRLQPSNPETFTVPDLSSQGFVVRTGTV